MGLGSETRARDLLTGLTPDQRDVLVLRIFGELPLEQVAAILGKRQGAVKALQHRALATLRRTLFDSTDDSTNDSTNDQDHDQERGRP
jgi:DNA-directed RNA polymerase specialized sigma24 family protein